MTDSIRVVLVDDHELMRRGTRTLLDASDAIEVVGEAADGAAGLALIESEMPDVALVDIAMPGINGIEVTRQAKRIAPGVPILILTVHDEEVYVRALLEAGAAGYLLKDVHGSDLVDAVRAVARGDAVVDPSITAALFRSVIAKQATTHQGAALLSDRELDVLRRAAMGDANKQIASTLGVSPRTVQSHMRNIFDKLQVGSRTEAVIYGLRHGLLTMEDLQ